MTIITSMKNLNLFVLFKSRHVTFNLELKAQKDTSEGVFFIAVFLAKFWVLVMAILPKLLGILHRCCIIITSAHGI